MLIWCVGSISSSTGVSTYRAICRPLSSSSTVLITHVREISIVSWYSYLKIYIYLSNFVKASAASECYNIRRPFLPTVLLRRVAVYFLLFYFIMFERFQTFHGISIWIYISRTSTIEASAASECYNIRRPFLPTVDFYGDFIFIYSPFHFRCSRYFMVLWH